MAEERATADDIAVFILYYKERLEQTQEDFPDEDWFQLEERLRIESVPNDFKIETLLHEDTVASVYKGTFSHNHVEFAVKVYDKSKIRNEHTLQMSLFRERNIHRILGCKFITGFHATGNHLKFLYLLIEFAPYGDLARLLREINGGLAEPQAVLIFGQILYGLHYIHFHNIIHRNLTPEHCLVFEGGRIKLTGFASSCIATSESNLFIGTPLFAAPEMTSTNFYTDAVDWYAFGCMLNLILRDWMAFGFDGREPIRLSSEGKDLITRLLERDPTKRLGSGENGIKDMFSHPWFNNLALFRLYRKKIRYKVMDWPLPPFSGKPIDDSIFFEANPNQDEAVWKFY